MADKLRWGVLGTARIAEQLVRAWSRSPRHALAAVASRDEARARAWAEKYEAPRVMPSYEELLASDEVDAVYVPLPNGLHKDWTVRAAQAGKHVLCEKPLAAAPSDVQEIIDARDRAGVTILEAFMYRFHPKTLKLKQLVDAGAVGDVRTIRSAFTFRLRDPRNIRMNRALAGGSLMDVGCYPVNLARLLAGREPLAVQARAQWGADAATVDPGVSEIPPLDDAQGAAHGVDHTLAGLLEFPGGALALIDCSFVADIHQWVGISGSHGHLGATAPFRMGEEEQMLLYDHDGLHEEIRVPGANEYAEMVNHFAAAVLDGDPLSYSLEDSLGQARVLDALYRAARSGHRELV
jgi:predicted dehydrogenase